MLKRPMIGKSNPWMIFLCPTDRQSFSVLAVACFGLIFFLFSNVLDCLYMGRDQQIQAIEESFRLSKLMPVHQTKPELEPVEIIPLLPDFDRYDGPLICTF